MHTLGLRAISFSVCQLKGTQMTRRFSVWTTPLAFIVAAGLLPSPIAGQSPPAAPKKWIAPRTPYGQPDLQGIWSNATITPFERPRELAGKEYFTEKEA